MTIRSSTHAVAAGADVLCVTDRDFYDPSVGAFCKEEDIQVMDEIALLEILRLCVR
jgi:hypothetical protein